MAGKKQGAAHAARPEKTAKRTGDHAGEVVFENPLLPHKKLLAMYADIAACSAMERQAGALLRRRKAAGFKGHEAALIGVVHNLLANDRVSAAGDAVMPRLLLGDTYASILQGLRDGAEAKPRSGAVLPRVEDAERMNTASQAAKRAKKAAVAVYVRADEPEEWLETLKSAGKRELPMVFICEDDPGLKRGKRDKLWKKVQKVAQRHEVPVIPVDSDDVVAMYRTAQEAMTRSRMALGSAVLWCERWTLAKDKLEPVKMFEQYLTARWLLSPAEKRRISTEAAAKMDTA